MSAFNQIEAVGPAPRRLGTRDSALGAIHGLGTRDSGLGTHRAFTLIEIIVVIGITAILMFILFIPLSRSLDLQARGRARIAGQENVRAAMRRLSRDLNDAMEVYEPRPLALWGYTAWNMAANPPVPQPGATPEEYDIPNGVIAMRLPKQAFYCKNFDHFVSQDDIDKAFGTGTPYDMVALDSCPRHPGSPVELRPVTPMEPDQRIVAYFIGLKDPGFRRAGAPGSGAPHGEYDNLLLFRTGRATLNTYALYRVEFDPRDPANLNGPNLNPLYASWTLDGTKNGPPNPRFFYDATPVAGPGGAFPRYYWWKQAAVEVMSSETSDCVKFVETAGKLVPHSLVTFGPGQITGEVAQPNRTEGSLASRLVGGTSVPADIPPVLYETDHGHWISRRQPDASFPDGNDPKRVIGDAELIGPSPAAANEEGPEITVVADSGGAINPAFNSTKPNAVSSPRSRLVTYDPLTGRISFAIARVDYSKTSSPAPAANGDRDHFSATIDPNTFTTTIAPDAVKDPGGLPSSLGAALGDPRFQTTTMIVPGSEVVALVDTNTGDSDVMRRAGWTGLGSTLDRFVAQGDLAENEYAINYKTGEIVLSDRTPALWVNGGGTASVGPGLGRELQIEYQFQTNLPTDAVKVTYLTREMLNVNMGIVQYTRKNAEALPLEVSERIAVRNLRR